MAIMTVRDLPPAQRRAWQNLFHHYVFDADANTSAHIPETAAGRWVRSPTRWCETCGRA
jgi:hypothetical protein